MAPWTEGVGEPTDGKSVCLARAILGRVPMRWLVILRGAEKRSTSPFLEVARGPFAGVTCAAGREEPRHGTRAVSKFGLHDAPDEALRSGRKGAGTH